MPPRAFTLIELVLVIAIIAVITTIALPRYSASLARYRADLAARKVAADLGAAQTRARSSSTSQTIAFNTTTSQYQLIGLSDPERPAQNWIVRLKDEPFAASIGTAVFGGDGTLVFNGFGVPDSGGTVTVNVGNVVKTVSVDADSGAVSIR